MPSRIPTIQPEFTGTPRERVEIPIIRSCGDKLTLRLPVRGIPSVAAGAAADDAIVQAWATIKPLSGGADPEAGSPRQKIITTANDAAQGRVTNDGTADGTGEVLFVWRAQDLRAIGAGRFQWDMQVRLASADSVYTAVDPSLFQLNQDVTLSTALLYPLAQSVVFQNTPGALLDLGQTLDLNAVGVDENAQAIVGRSPAYASLHPLVATVDPVTGVVTPVAPGAGVTGDRQATIRATLDGKTADYVVGVYGVATVLVTTPAITALAPLGTRQFGVVLRAGDNTQLNAVYRAVAWSSTPSNVGAIGATSGLFTAGAAGVADGTATVTASCEGHADTDTVSVQTPILSATLEPLYPSALASASSMKGVTTGTHPMRLRGWSALSGGGVEVPVAGRTIVLSSNDTAVATLTAGATPDAPVVTYVGTAGWGGAGAVIGATVDGVATPTKTVRSYRRIVGDVDGNSNQSDLLSIKRKPAVRQLESIAAPGLFVIRNNWAVAGRPVQAMMSEYAGQSRPEPDARDLVIRISEEAANQAFLINNTDDPGYDVPFVTNQITGHFTTLQTSVAASLRADAVTRHYDAHYIAYVDPAGFDHFEAVRSAINTWLAANGAVGGAVTAGFRFLNWGTEAELATPGGIKYAGQNGVVDPSNAGARLDFSTSENTVFNAATAIAGVDADPAGAHRSSLGQHIAAVVTAETLRRDFALPIREPAAVRLSYQPRASSSWTVLAPGAALPLAYQEVRRLKAEALDANGNVISGYDACWHRQDAKQVNQEDIDPSFVYPPVPGVGALYPAAAGQTSVIARAGRQTRIHSGTPTGTFRHAIPSLQRLMFAPTGLSGTAVADVWTAAHVKGMWDVRVGLKTTSGGRVVGERLLEWEDVRGSVADGYPSLTPAPTKQGFLLQQWDADTGLGPELRDKLVADSVNCVVQTAQHAALALPGTKVWVAIGKWVHANGAGYEPVKFENSDASDYMALNTETSVFRLRHKRGVSEDHLTDLATTLVRVSAEAPRAYQDDVRSRRAAGLLVRGGPPDSVGPTVLPIQNVPFLGFGVTPFGAGGGTGRAVLGGVPSMEIHFLLLLAFEPGSGVAGALPGSDTYHNYSVYSG